MPKFGRMRKITDPYPELLSSHIPKARGDLPNQYPASYDRILLAVYSLKHQLKSAGIGLVTCDTAYSFEDRSSLPAETL